MSNIKLENANKLTFLVKEFPEKDVEQILDLLQMPPIQSNAGFWLAQELGWLSPVKDSKISFVKAPDSWAFGDITMGLIDQIEYCFHRLSKDETDLEEKWLTDWLTGYPPQEIVLSMHYLLDQKILAEYEIVDHNAKLGDSTYKFYTLFENLEQQWGRKQFKVDPSIDEPEYEDDTPEEDKHLNDK